MAAAPIDLLPSTEVSTSGIGDACDGLKRYAGLFGSINVSAAPSGGSPTLDVYVQGTPDGSNWQDVVHYQFTGPGVRLFQISQFVRPGEIVEVSDGSNTVVPATTGTMVPQDGTLTGDTVVQGPFGDKLRVKYVFSAGGSTGTYTVSASAMPAGGP